MEKKIIDYLNSQRICVLAVEMLDGSPHASTVHFAYDLGSLTFFFLTDREYRKSEALISQGTTRASLVIGFNESIMKTFQVDGSVKLINEDLDKEKFSNFYFTKFPDKKKWANDPDAIFLSFTPTWWRYTDYKGPNGKEIISSENK